MNGDPQHEEEETPLAPKKPVPEKEEKSADDEKEAKQGSCGGSAA